MQPIRGYVGDTLSEVLIVDAHTGAITKYNPAKCTNMGRPRDAFQYGH